MADRARAVADNVAGSFFVDETCINCDTCRQLAPATFGDNGDFSFVGTQPGDGSERSAAARALVACPTGSIGCDDKRGLAQAADEFPLTVTPGVSYCGFASPKSFGGSSYLLEHPDGNWLIDSPRWVDRLARRIEERGGLRYIFLTHRDDVADAERYAARFGATRIIHRLELGAQPDAERVIDGNQPVALAPDFLAIPTPGHTRGHMVLLAGKRFLFSGDHIWWSRTRGRLNASRSVCRYSWPEQLRSLALLEQYSFEWVLPGHGERMYLSRAEMAAQLALLRQALGQKE